MIQLVAGMMTLTLAAVCGPTEEMRAVYVKDQFVERKLGKDAQGDPWSLWAADGSWVLMVYLDNGSACVVAAHKNGEPA